MKNNVAREETTDQGFIFDYIAKIYISVFVVWTAILLLGVFYLVVNRNAQCIRIRNLPLSLTAAACLHLFWSGGMFAYSMKTSYPCVAEYWVMNTFLPFGIALFQANNMRLLSISTQQEKLLQPLRGPYAIRAQTSSSFARRWWSRWKSMSLVRRTNWGIAVGMVVQMILSTAVFLASRKFHSFGTMGEPVSEMECRKGVEWILSIIWQFSWAWLFAPYILWKIRKIKDVHYWRLETTLCVVAALPASPLWLASLYSSDKNWATINQYFLPGAWFAPGGMAMVGATIFFPCYELATTSPGGMRIPGGLRAWRNRKHVSEINSETATDLSRSSLASVPRSRGDGMYSKRAFNKCLAEDSRPLFHFAASKEFSGENIMFLDAVRDWKASWASVSDHLGKGYDWDVDPQGYRLHFFKRAVGIYTSCVDLHSAEFPINIESQIYAQLHERFDEASQHIDPSRYQAPGLHSPSNQPNLEVGDDENLIGGYGPKSEFYSMERFPPSRKSSTVVTATDDAEAASARWNPNERVSQKSSMTSFGTSGISTLANNGGGGGAGAGAGDEGECGGGGGDFGYAPHDFGIHEFDAAEKSIRTLVYSCTWPKFVNSLGEQSM